ncbi:hypothetical protein M9H77_30363 [Catharanthus roseus]|uniref:Uncharacterized protein n=1 Tax=Catharanthus roseus TaxID=4058 RepID=A0ACC0A0Y4_CATRO|nr:hypothetical protein M9H77_30363 [Catharanthus roseus]
MIRVEHKVPLENFPKGTRMFGAIAWGQILYRELVHVGMDVVGHSAKSANDKFKSMSQRMKSNSHKDTGKHLIICSREVSSSKQRELKAQFKEFMSTRQNFQKTGQQDIPSQKSDMIASNQVKPIYKDEKLEEDEFRHKFRSI